MALGGCNEVGYCPTSRGARCHTGCPLGPDGALREYMSSWGPGLTKKDTDAFRPVPGEVHDALAERTTVARIAAVLLQPGLDEERRGYPLAGKSGLVWNECLRAAGRRRQDVDLFNLTDCRPPGPASGAWTRMEKALVLVRTEAAQKIAKLTPSLSKVAAAELAANTIPHPGACCRPRLLRDLDPYDCILALGTEAYKALTGEERAITKVMGSPRVVPLARSGGGDRLVKLFALPHPAHVLRAPAWRDLYVRLLAKAFRFFEDRLRWVEPGWIVNPTPEEFSKWLLWMKRSVPFVSIDCETNNIEPMRASLEMVQIATPDLDENGDVTDDQLRAREGGTVSQVVVLILPRGAYGTRDSKEETALFERPIRVMLGSEVESHRRLLAGLMRDPSIVKIGSNLGYYDLMVFESGPDRLVREGQFCSVLDLLFAARFRAPDLPKGLKENGVVFTDIERWDTTDAGEKALRDERGWVRVKYAGYDAVVGARIGPPLVRAAADAGAFRELPEGLRPRCWPPPGQPTGTPWNLWELDHERQRMCVRLHRRGIAIDQKERARLQLRFESSVALRRDQVAKIVEKLWAEGLIRSREADPATLDAVEDAEEADAFNAGSADQLRVLLYEDLGLDIPPGVDENDAYTETGLLSTDDKVLRAFLAAPRLHPLVRQLVSEVRLLRRERNKVLGTFLWPLVPGGERQSEYLWSDGRVRGVWSAHTTAPARLSCSGFPLQIIGSRKGLDVLKRLFVACPGDEPRGLVWQCHDAVALEVRVMIDGGYRTMFLGADIDQAHLRIMANHWKIARLQECFAEGLDPYGVLACDLFGDAFRNASGWGPDGFSRKKKPPAKGSPALAMRETAKQVRLALAYRVETATATATIMSAEFAEMGPDGRPTGRTVLPYLNLELPELGLRGTDVVEHWRDIWLKAEPDWEDAWRGCDDRYVDNGGFLEDPVLQRRSGCLSDGKAQETANNEILTAEASIMSLAEREIERRFDPDGDGLAVKGLSAGVLKRTLADAMTVRVPWWPDIPFTVEVKLGQTLADV